MGMSVSTASTKTLVDSPPPASLMSRPEKDINNPVDGWPTAVQLLTNAPDLQAFPTFTDLHLKSLLYYQAELILLREKLHEAEWVDFRRKDKDTSTCSDLRDLIPKFRTSEPQAGPTPNPQAAPTSEPQFGTQWSYIVKIREVLEKYDAALLKFSKLSELPEADWKNVECLRQCLLNVSDPANQMLTGPACATWGKLSSKTPEEPTFGRLCRGLFTGFFKSSNIKPEGIQDHLIIPRAGYKPDGLTMWVKNCFVPFWDGLWKTKSSKRLDEELADKARKKKNLILSRTFTDLSAAKARHRPKKSKKHTTVPCNQKCRDLLDSLTTYSGSWILHVTSGLITVVACLLPTAAISVLAKLHHMGEILGIIALFTGAFALGLICLTTTTSRVEIFTATAAFSAVMVVFVQGQLPSN